MIHYPKLIQIILNFTEIEALPKYIRNKSSEIQNLFSAEIPALERILKFYLGNFHNDGGVLKLSQVHKNE